MQEEHCCWKYQVQDDNLVMKYQCMKAPGLPCWVFSGRHTPGEGAIDNHFRALQLLVRNPKQRLPLKQVLEHPWIMGYAQDSPLHT